MSKLLVRRLHDDKGSSEIAHQRCGHFYKKRSGVLSMLWTIFVVLVVLWMLGMVTSYTLYGYIHILLVVAIAVLLIRLIQGRQAV